MNERFRAIYVVSYVERMASSFTSQEKVDNLYETICVVTKYINRKMIPSFHWNFGNSELITSKEFISCVIR